MIKQMIKFLIKMILILAIAFIAGMLIGLMNDTMLFIGSIVLIIILPIIAERGLK